MRQALGDAQSKVDEQLRRAALAADVAELRRLLQDGELSDGLDRRSAVELEAADAQHGFTPLMLATAAGLLCEMRCGGGASDLRAGL